MVIESGDFNLADLVEIRKKQSHPHSSVMILEYLAFLNKAYLYLEDHKIYHSDTKLENIVYSNSRKALMIINFGGGKFVPKNKMEVTLIEYVLVGTKAYNTPEKQMVFDFFSEEAGKSKIELSEKDLFNPFKCDMWSLGIWIQKIMGENIPHDAKLKNLVKKMLQKNWQKRLDARELDTILKNLNVHSRTDFYTKESKHFMIINENNLRIEEIVSSYEYYSSNNMNKEALEIAIKEYSLHGELYQNKCPALNRLMTPFEKNGIIDEVKKAEQELKEWHLHSNEKQNFNVHYYAYKRREINEIVEVTTVKKI